MPKFEIYIEFKPFILHLTASQKAMLKWPKIAPQTPLQSSNPRSLIKPSETLLVELTGTHKIVSY